MAKKKIVKREDKEKVSTGRMLKEIDKLNQDIRRKFKASIRDKEEKYVKTKKTKKSQTIRKCENKRRICDIEM